MLPFLCVLYKIMIYFLSYRKMANGKVCLYPKKRYFFYIIDKNLRQDKVDTLLWLKYNFILVKFEKCMQPKGYNVKGFI